MFKRLLHALVFLSTWTDYRRFTRFKPVDAIQQNVLSDILKRNQTSQFGIEHQFEHIYNEEDYRRLVPLRTWEAFEPWIDRMNTPSDHVLSASDTCLFEPTSGSSGRYKLIPCTAVFRASYGRAVNVWLHDLYRQYRGIARGSHFWSLSPAVPHKIHENCQIPVGFDEDSQYLGVAGWFLRQIFVLPPELKALDDQSAFRFQAACYLVGAADLSLISVWNPSFLQLILETLVERQDDIAAWLVARNKKRAKLFLHVMRQGITAETCRLLWPKLALVSAWGSGESRPGFVALRLLFPHAAFQEKGLLATEGIMSFPLVEAQGFVPAYQSHYFEFVDCASDATKTLSQLEISHQYRLILTTDCLYRYDIGDVVEVRGFFRGLPLLDFCGRAGVCDLVGEKLNKIMAGRIIERFIAEHDVVDWAFLAPERYVQPQSYALFVAIKPESATPGREMADWVESELAQSFHYKYARELGQLGPLTLNIMPLDARNKWIERCLQDGMKLGDIKFAALDMRDGWAEYFRARG